MRIVKEFVKEEIKITVYHWNNRYLLKLEWAQFEQTFKVHEWDIAHETDIDALLNPDFMRAAISRFQEMASSLGQAMQGIA